jgi:3-oxoacyl-[acyl-carrier protein] reductase
LDLGISGRTALLTASSRGLGRACAEALAAEGVHVVINGLNEGTLDRAAEAIRADHGVEVTPVRADINSREGRETLLS